jgi:hypothetical protein
MVVGSSPVNHNQSGLQGPSQLFHRLGKPLFLVGALDEHRGAFPATMSLAHHGSYGLVRTKTGVARRQVTDSSINLCTTVTNAQVPATGVVWTYYVHGIVAAITTNTQGLLAFAGNLIQINNAGNIQLVLSSLVRLTTSNALAAGDEFHVWAFGSSATGYNVDLNGTLTSAAGGSGNYAALTAIGFAGRTFTGSLIKVAGWNSIVPEGARRAVERDSRILFKSRRNIVNKAVAALPTLSNARMGSLTSTGGVPLVDYAF